MGIREVSGSVAFVRERLAKAFARAAPEGTEGLTRVEAFDRDRAAEPAERVGRHLGGLPGTPAARRVSRKGRRVHD